MSWIQDVPSSVPRDHSKTTNQALLQHTASVSDEAMVGLCWSQLRDLGQKHLPSMPEVPDFIPALHETIRIKLII